MVTVLAVREEEREVYRSRDRKEKRIVMSGRRSG